ncbi:hypothetical protein OESDEN_08931 [Oesophagostomum dentatum]|uniref:Uncharacterized protein n=1 Tax=Oesophagostomum dentatum TaxID=61180 RepID=A0A0B1T111_OESDE|nr:hypothetical protein OESDEN_08931 [Oesophagostomum dentatum]
MCHKISTEVVVELLYVLMRGKIYKEKGGIGAMDWLESVLDEYSRTVHPPLVLILCIAGSLGHLVSIATLSSMMSPTNAFLISMSWLRAVKYREIPNDTKNAVRVAPLRCVCRDATTL